MMMGGDFGWGGGWMFFGGLLMLLFWGGIITLIVLAVRALTGNSNPSSRSNATPLQRNGAAQTPLEILQTRYTKGEISRDEYMAMQRDLQAT